MVWYAMVQTPDFGGPNWQIGWHGCCRSEGGDEGQPAGSFMEWTRKSFGFHAPRGLQALGCQGVGIGHPPRQCGSTWQSRGGLPLSMPRWLCWGGCWLEAPELWQASVPHLAWATTSPIRLPSSKPWRTVLRALSQVQQGRDRSHMRVPAKTSSSHTSQLYCTCAITCIGWQIFGGNPQYSRKLDS